MPEHNILSIKVKLAVVVAAGQAISSSGHLATTYSGDKEPLGIAQYEGAVGESIAVMTIGLIDVPQDGSLAVGDMLKAQEGAMVKTTTTTEAFATVTEINGMQMEILIK